MTWGDGITTGTLFRAVAALTVQLLDQPVEELLYHDGGDVKHAIDAAAPDDEKDKVTKAVEVHQVVVRLLAHHIITESYGGEGDKTKVDGLEVRPFFYRVVHSGGTTGNDHGAEEQDQHYPVHGGFPRVQIVPRVLGNPGPASTGSVLAVVHQAFAPQIPLVYRAQYPGQECNDTLQEEVEEEDASRTAQYTITDESDLSSSGPRSGHAKTCNRKTLSIT